MANITLSVKGDVYKRMRKHSEIKWSEFVRKAIEKRLDELKSLDSNQTESVLSMIASESVLKKEWDNKKDERWNDV